MRRIMRRIKRRTRGQYLLLMSPSASPDASHDASPTKKSLDSSQIVKITKKWRLWMKKEDENLKIDKFEHKEDS